MPQGLEAMFDRMASTIEELKTKNQRSHTLAIRILSWAARSAEPLTIPQLAIALEPEFTKLQNPEATIPSHLREFHHCLG